ncbi:MAG: chromate efflux transporter [Rhodospirillales bacterium]
MADAEKPTENTPPSFAEMFAVWAKIGLLSFGGPAGQIALMHREIVEDRKWISDNRFLHALNFCMLLPGPEAMQLATYIGWLTHGLRGGLTAGLLFVIPGGLVIWLLAWIYAAYGETSFAAAVFYGIKGAVLAIVLHALFRIAGKALKRSVDWLIAAFAFIAIFAFDLPFPLIILIAALAGLLVHKPGATGGEDAVSPAPVSTAATVRTVSLWLMVWLLPLVAVWLSFGGDHVFSQIGLFFSKLAMVTFGGAYAVLAYMAQEAVDGYGWLSAREMLDALGLAETTPGPLILVTEFVGYLGAYRSPGLPPALMGAIGALIALWATFAPCFLWIFAGAPYIERLQQAGRIAGALKGVTAAVVGVILNLAVWFSIQAIFLQTRELDAGPLKLLVPDFASIDLAMLAIALVACFMILVRHMGIITTLFVTACLGLAWRYWLGG